MIDVRLVWVFWWWKLNSIVRLISAGVDENMFRCAVTISHSYIWVEKYSLLFTKIIISAILLVLFRRTFNSVEMMVV